jgi:hypothetical protein
MNVKKHTILSCQESEDVFKDIAGNRKMGNQSLLSCKIKKPGN